MNKNFFTHSVFFFNGTYWNVHEHVNSGIRNFYWLNLLTISMKQYTSIVPSILTPMMCTLQKNKIVNAVTLVTSLTRPRRRGEWCGRARCSRSSGHPKQYWHPCPGRGSGNIQFNDTITSRSTEVTRLRCVISTEFTNNCHSCYTLNLQLTSCIM